MKRIVLMALLALALPLAAFANSQVDFTNSGGTLSGSSAGMRLSGSTLVAVNGLNGGLITGNLGTLGFSTGTLLSRNLQMGATFNGGGSFLITGNGTNGIHNGVIFNGTFSGPVTWTLITLANGTHNYTLTGTVVGAWFTGASVQGVTVQLTINTGRGFFNGQTMISSGDTNITVPEPGTLGLLLQSLRERAAQFAGLAPTKLEQVLVSGSAGFIGRRTNPVVTGERIAEPHVHAAFNLPGASFRVDGAANVVRSHNTIQASILVEDHHLSGIAEGHMRGRVLQGFWGTRFSSKVANIISAIFASN